MITEPLVSYTVLMTLSGFLFGTLFGRMTWGRSEAADPVAVPPARTEEVNRLNRELSAAREQVRPLADEVDRLSRELARTRKPDAAPAPVATPAPQPPTPAPQPLPQMTPLPQPTPMPQPLPVVQPSPVVTFAAAPVMSAPEMTGPDVRQLKGVGDKFAQALGAIGLGNVAAIAALDEATVATMDTQLGVFNGRLRRDKLIEQAQLLCGGRTSEYEARFGKIGTTVGRA